MEYGKKVEVEIKKRKYAIVRKENTNGKYEWKI
jgi:hypothetical protein